MIRRQPVPPPVTAVTPSEPATQKMPSRPQLDPILPVGPHHRACEDYFPHRGLPSEALGRSSEELVDITAEGTDDTQPLPLRLKAAVYERDAWRIGQLPTGSSNLNTSDLHALTSAESGVRRCMAVLWMAVIWQLVQHRSAARTIDRRRAVRAHFDLTSHSAQLAGGARCLGSRCRRCPPRCRSSPGKRVVRRKVVTRDLGSGLGPTVLVTGSG
jgi:hypothetical protein